MARAQTPVSSTQTQPVPEARGFAEALSTYLARGGLRRGGKFTKGPLKGMTINEATAKAKDLWANASPATKEKYAQRAQSFTADSERPPVSPAPQRRPQAQGTTTDTPDSYEETSTGGEGVTDANQFFRQENSRTAQNQRSGSNSSSRKGGISQAQPQRGLQTGTLGQKPRFIKPQNASVSASENANARRVIAEETGGALYGQTAANSQPFGGLSGGMSGGLMPPAMSTDNPRNGAFVKPAPPSQMRPGLGDLRMADDERLLNANTNAAQTGAAMGQASGEAAARRVAPTPNSPSQAPSVTPSAPVMTADPVAQAQKDFGLDNNQTFDESTPGASWVGYKGGRRLYQTGVPAQGSPGTPEQIGAITKQLANRGGADIPVTPSAQTPRRVMDTTPQESYTPGIGLVPVAKPVTGPDAEISRDQYDQAGSRMRAAGGTTKQDRNDASLRSEYERQGMGASQSGLPSRQARPRRIF